MGVSSTTKKIIDLLSSLPNIHDADSQRAFIYQVGLETKLQSQISIGKPPAQFASLLVSTAINYGKLSDGRHALEAIVETAKDYVGQDKKTYCDKLIEELQNCKDTQIGVLNISNVSHSLYKWFFWILIITTSCIVLIWGYVYFLGKSKKSSIIESFDNDSLGWNITESGDYYDAYFENGQYVIARKSEDNFCNVETIIPPFDMPESFKIELISTWKSGEERESYGLFVGNDNRNSYNFSIHQKGDVQIWLVIDDKVPDGWLTYQKNKSLPGNGTNSNVQKIQFKHNTFTYFVNDK